LLLAANDAGGFAVKSKGLQTVDNHIFPYFEPCSELTHG
jgi:hypothetical protein